MATISASRIPIFSPFDEFRNFQSYVACMESVGAHKFGIAKVISPREYVARLEGYNNLSFSIEQPLLQIIKRSENGFTQVSQLTLLSYLNN